MTQSDQSNTYASALGALLAEALNADPMLVEHAIGHLERHPEAPGYPEAADMLRRDLAEFREPIV